MIKDDFWKEWEKLDGKFGAEVMKLCKQHGFITRLKLKEA